MPYRYNAITGEFDYVLDASATGAITEIETDSGSVNPVAGIVNLFGDSPQGISTSGAGDTATITIADASTTQKGSIELATDAETIAGASSSLAIVPSSLAAKLGVQTQYALPIGNTTSGAINWTSAGTNGQVCIAATGADPEFASITSTGGTIAITEGANSLNLEIDDNVANQFDTDSGSAVPASGILEIFGTAAQGISTSGASNTVTLTVQDGTESQKGVIELATAAETTTGTSTALAVHPAGLNTKLGTQTDHGLIYGQGGAGANLESLAEATNGQLPIGNTGSPPTLATLSEGANIAITNAAGSITIAANSQEQIVNVTALDNTDSPYTVLSTDYYLTCDVSIGVLTVDLPDAGTAGRVIIVKDSGGDAATNNITVTTDGGVDTIDGATTFVMNTDYEAANFLDNGTSWEVF